MMQPIARHTLLGAALAVVTAGAAAKDLVVVSGAVPIPRASRRHTTSRTWR